MLKIVEYGGQHHHRGTDCVIIKNPISKAFSRDLSRWSRGTKQELDTFFICFSFHHQEATKPSERHVSFAPAVKDGVDESRVREAAGNPSSGRKATPMGSIFASLGGVKTAPKTLSATAKSAGEGASKRSRLGCPDAGKEVPKQQSHGREKRKSMASPTSRISSHGRGGGKGNESSPPQGPRRVCRDSARETKAAAEQAAKMAERRQR